MKVRKEVIIDIYRNFCINRFSEQESIYYQIPKGAFLLEYQVDRDDHYLRNRRCPARVVYEYDKKIRKGKIYRASINPVKFTKRHK
jgi:hypothetical protein